MFIVGRTTLFTPVDINLQQVVDFLNFYACSDSTFEWLDLNQWLDSSEAADSTRSETEMTRLVTRPLSDST
jgi:hypothetical protein